MNPSASAPGYLFLFRGPDWDHGMAPDQLQHAMDSVMAWFDGLQRQDKVLAGQPLAAEGRCISGKQGAPVSDGPFAEAKEAVGGYLLLKADSLEEAVAVARSCPTLAFGITIEVRPALNQCPVFRRARQRLAVVPA